MAFAIAAPGARAGGWEAWRSVLLPDFFRLQYAGQSGFFAMGAGYSWWDGKAEASANYGYVPAFVTETPIHTFSERNAVSPLKLRLPHGLDLEPIVAGITANISLGDRFQLYMPKPKGGYYWPDALYFWLFAGAELGFPLRERAFPQRIGFQLEIGTINQYLLAYVTNRSVGLRDILSLSLSAQIYL